MRRGPNRKFSSLPALLRRGGRSPVVGGASGPPAVLSRIALVLSTEGVSVSGGVVDAWATCADSGVSASLAATLTARPAYSATGGVGSRPLITFDGINDFLTGIVTKGSAWSDYEIGIVGQRLSFTAANEGIAGYALGGTPRFYLNDNTSTTFRFTVVGGANVTGGNPSTAPAHYSGDAASGGTVNARQNGTVINTTTTTVTSRADGESWVLGSRTAAGADYAHYALQAAYIGPLLTAGERTDLRAYLTAQTGITC